MDHHQRRADAAELLGLHPLAGGATCRCGRPTPCAVAAAARAALASSEGHDGRQQRSVRNVGRAAVPRLWMPRRRLMAWTAQTLYGDGPGAPGGRPRGRPRTAD